MIQRNGKISHALGRINIVKMAILPNGSYRFNVIPIKIPMAFSTKLEKIIIKYINIRNYRGSRTAKAILRKKSKVGGITLPDFRKTILVYIPIYQNYIYQYIYTNIPKLYWYWHKNRHMDQWNRTEGLEINPHSYGQLIFDKGGKNIQWEKDSLFSKWCWKSWTPTSKSVKLEHILTPYTKINSKWLKDLNIRHDTIKLLEEIIGKTFSDINRTNMFLGQSPKATEIKTKIIKLDLIKLPSFCTAKETINKTERQPTEWEKIFANDATGKGLISKIYSSYNSTTKKQTTQSKNGQKT